MELQDQTADFASIVTGMAPDAPVPTCPDWRLRDLVGHMGQAPRWMAGVVRSGAVAVPPDPKDAEPRADWRAWLLADADELTGTVAEVGPDTPVWTLVGTRPALWWVRRRSRTWSCTRPTRRWPPVCRSGCRKPGRPTSSARPSTCSPRPVWRPSAAAAKGRSRCDRPPGRLARHAHGGRAHVAARHR